MVPFGGYLSFNWERLNGLSEIDYYLSLGDGTSAVQLSLISESYLPPVTLTCLLIEEEP